MVYFGVAIMAQLCVKLSPLICTNSFRFEFDNRNSHTAVYFLDVDFFCFDIISIEMTVVLKSFLKTLISKWIRRVQKSSINF